MRITTLKHHRKTSNMYRFTLGTQTITLTRRFLPGTRALRVRVTSETVSGQGEGNWTDYRDYTDMHEGDAAFNKQANNFCAEWEKRYCAPKHTAPSPSVPTATQWAGGATLTPTRAAALATPSTGVRHVAAEDGRTLCRADAPTGAPLAGTVTGRVIGEYTVKVPNGRMGRTDAMLLLLEAMRATPSNPHFQALCREGYGNTTTWDQLGEMLRPVASTALHALGSTDPQARADAEVFLTACQPTLAFYKDDEPEEDTAPALPAPAHDARTVPLGETRVGRLLGDLALGGERTVRGRAWEQQRLYLLCKWVDDEMHTLAASTERARDARERQAALREQSTVLFQGIGFVHLLACGFTAETEWDKVAELLASLIPQWKTIALREETAYMQASGEPGRRMLGNLLIGRRLFLAAVEGIIPYLPEPPATA